MKLRYYIIKRILLFSLVLFGISVITFFVSHVIPGDPARLAAGLHAKPEQVEFFRHKMGLDKPIFVQYFIYMKGLLQGDLGISIRTRRPVIEDILNYLPATLELTIVSLILIVILGIPLGVISAVHKDKLYDHVCRIWSLFGVSAPTFWVGLMVLLVFYLKLGLIPSGGRLDSTIQLTRITGLYILDSLLTFNFPALVSSIIHILPPACVLAYSELAIITRMTRATMLETLSQDYIKTAKAKGLSERKVIYKHALRNALIPIVSVIGLTLGYLLGGSFLVETVFSWPGIGLYAARSIMELDFNAIMGVTIVYALIYSLINLIVDIIYTILDPRIRLG